LNLTKAGGLSESFKNILSAAERSEAKRSEAKRSEAKLREASSKRSFFFPSIYFGQYLGHILVIQEHSQRS
jgi:hypothetical protein